ncbi:GNAT family N-acetyltransferase [Sedimentitalea todarodis]|uniref:GNAT family N-acetyltransferase n=1 Tax=Sedimentitalea todarodis TaxID=1631240 RepID=A0ABU3V7V5_9RHOB|nr:GNAT family N-acetyltransferase [Sedimentitalea todarodis]MDU9002240.1 GNAT family N-acetyltransferase [Sedimentitalea todarodis]
MKTSKTSIRAYREGDIELVMAAWRNANALAHPFLTAGFVAELEQDIRHTYVPMAETYVLEENGDVVGFIALLGNEIGGLFLDPSRHGRGYGKALVTFAVDLKGPLTVDVFRDNRIGRAFYDRVGFAFVAEELHEASGQMSRKLAMPGA